MPIPADQDHELSFGAKNASGSDRDSNQNDNDSILSKPPSYTSVFIPHQPTSLSEEVSRSSPPLSLSVSHLLVNGDDSSEQNIETLSLRSQLTYEETAGSIWSMRDELHFSDYGSSFRNTDSILDDAKSIKLESGRTRLAPIVSEGSSSTKSSVKNSSLHTSASETSTNATDRTKQLNTHHPPRFHSLLNDADHANDQTAVQLQHTEFQQLSNDPLTSIQFADSLFKANRYAEAWPLLSRLASQKDSRALYLLGYYIHHGAVSATIESRSEAETYFKEAAALGDVDASFMLSQFDSEAGQLPRSNKWLMIAAHKGHPEANYILGMKYLQEDGFQFDIEQSLRYFEDAVQNGHQKAAARLAELKGLT